LDTDEENILKNIFLKCNIKLLINNNRDFNEELNKNDLCIIKKNNIYYLLQNNKK
jgi:cell division protein FtsB